MRNFCKENRVLLGIVAAVLVIAITVGIVSCANQNKKPNDPLLGSEPTEAPTLKPTEKPTEKETEATDPTEEETEATDPTEEETEPTEEETEEVFEIPVNPEEPTEVPTQKPTEPKPTEPKPTQPKPTEPKPTEPKPTEPKPTEETLDDEAYCAKYGHDFQYKGTVPYDPVNNVRGCELYRCTRCCKNDERPPYTYAPGKDHVCNTNKLVETIGAVTATTNRYERYACDICGEMSRGYRGYDDQREFYVSRYGTGYSYEYLYFSVIDFRGDVAKMPVVRMNAKYDRNYGDVPNGTVVTFTWIDNRGQAQTYEWTIGEHDVQMTFVINSDGTFRMEET